MGYLTMDACADVRTENSTDKLILILLARFLNEKSGECFPSIPTLAKQACTSTNTIRNSIKRLTESKIISWKWKQSKFGFVRSFKFDCLERPPSKVEPHSKVEPPSISEPLQDLNPFNNDVEPPSEVEPLPIQKLNPNKEINEKKNKEMTASKLTRLAVKKTVGLTDEQLEKICNKFKDNPDALSEIHRVVSLCVRTKWLGVANPYSYIIGVGQREVDKWNGFVARSDASERMRSEAAYA